MHTKKTYSHFNKIVEIKHKGSNWTNIDMLVTPLKVVSSMQRSHQQIRNKSVMEPPSKAPR
jgi:hypothetical protein